MHLCLLDSLSVVSFQPSSSMTLNRKLSHGPVRPTSLNTSPSSNSGYRISSTFVPPEGGSVSPSSRAPHLITGSPRIKNGLRSPSSSSKGIPTLLSPVSSPGTPPMLKSPSGAPKDKIGSRSSSAARKTDARTKSKAQPTEEQAVNHVGGGRAESDCNGNSTAPHTETMEGGMLTTKGLRDGNKKATTNLSKRKKSQDLSSPTCDFSKVFCVEKESDGGLVGRSNDACINGNGEMKVMHDSMNDANKKKKVIGTYKKRSYGTMGRDDRINGNKEIHSKKIPKRELLTSTKNKEVPSEALEIVNDDELNGENSHSNEIILLEKQPESVTQTCDHFADSEANIHSNGHAVRAIVNMSLDIISDDCTGDSSPFLNGDSIDENDLDSNGFEEKDLSWDFEESQFEIDAPFMGGGVGACVCFNDNECCCSEKLLRELSCQSEVKCVVKAANNGEKLVEPPNDDSHEAFNCDSSNDISTVKEPAKHDILINDVSNDNNDHLTKAKMQQPVEVNKEYNANEETCNVDRECTEEFIRYVFQMSLLEDLNNKHGCLDHSSELRSAEQVARSPSNHHAGRDSLVQGVNRQMLEEMRTGAKRSEEKNDSSVDNMAVSMNGNLQENKCDVPLNESQTLCCGKILAMKTEHGSTDKEENTSSVLPLINKVNHNSECDVSETAACVDNNLEMSKIPDRSHINSLDIEMDTVIETLSHLAANEPRSTPDGQERAVSLTATSTCGVTLVAPSDEWREQQGGVVMGIQDCVLGSATIGKDNCGEGAVTSPIITSDGQTEHANDTFCSSEAQAAGTAPPEERSETDNKILDGSVTADVNPVVFCCDSSSQLPNSITSTGDDRMQRTTEGEVAVDKCSVGVEGKSIFPSCNVKETAVASVTGTDMKHDSVAEGNDSENFQQLSSGSCGEDIICESVDGPTKLETDDVSSAEKLSSTSQNEIIAANTPIDSIVPEVLLDVTNSIKGEISVLKDFEIPQSMEIDICTEVDSSAKSRPKLSNKSDECVKNDKGVPSKTNNNKTKSKVLRKSSSSLLVSKPAKAQQGRLLRVNSVGPDTRKALHESTPSLSLSKSKRRSSKTEESEKRKSLSPDKGNSTLSQRRDETPIKKIRRGSAHSSNRGTNEPSEQSSAKLTGSSVSGSVKAAAPAPSSTAASSVVTKAAPRTARTGANNPATGRTAEGASKVNTAGGSRRLPIRSTEPIKTARSSAASKTGPAAVDAAELKKLEASLSAKTSEAEELKKEAQEVRCDLTKAERGVEALTVIVHHLTQQYDAFSTPALKSELNKTKDCLQSTKIILDESQSALQAAERKLREQEERAAAQREQLTAQHSSALEQLTQQHELELQQLTARHKDELAALGEEHEGVLRRELEKHKQELETTIEEHDKKVLELKASHASREQELESHSAALLKEQEKLKEHSKKLQESLLSDNDHRLVAIKKYCTGLQHEVDSLKSVVEMRNSELHKLRAQVTAMEQLEKDLEAIRERNRSLVAKTEDLNAQMDAKAKAERQLMTSNRELMESMSRESSMNKQLKLEKEELEWKLQQREALSASLPPMSTLDLMTRATSAATAGSSPLDGSSANSGPRRRSQSRDTSEEPSEVNSSKASSRGADKKFITSTPLPHPHVASSKDQKNGTMSSNNYKNSACEDSSRDTCRKLELTVETNNSPPSSPSMKGVVAKSNSVSFILDLNGSLPEDSFLEFPPSPRLRPHGTPTFNRKPVQKSRSSSLEKSADQSKGVISKCSSAGNFLNKNHIPNVLHSKDKHIKSSGLDNCPERGSHSRNVSESSGGSDSMDSSVDRVSPSGLSWTVPVTSTTRDQYIDLSLRHLHAPEVDEYNSDDSDTDGMQPDITPLVNMINSSSPSDSELSRCGSQAGMVSGTEDEDSITDGEPLVKSPSPIPKPIWVPQVGAGEAMISTDLVSANCKSNNGAAINGDGKQWDPELVGSPPVLSDSDDTPQG